MRTFDLVQEVSLKLRPVFEKHGVLKAIVFGSIARNEASRRSDLDLIVVQETGRRFLDRYEGMLNDITDLVTDRDVDLLIYTPDELTKISDRPFIKRILNESAVIYESKPKQVSS